MTCHKTVIQGGSHAHRAVYPDLQGRPETRGAVAANTIETPRLQSQMHRSGFASCAIRGGGSSVLDFQCLPAIEAGAVLADSAQRPAGHTAGLCRITTTGQSGPG